MEVRTSDELLRKAMYQIFKGKCFWTKRDLEENEFHIDHVVPKARGGKDKIDNYVLSCPRENVVKNCSLIEEDIIGVLYHIKNCYSKRVEELYLKLKNYKEIKLSNIENRYGIFDIESSSMYHAMNMTKDNRRVKDIATYGSYITSTEKCCLVHYLVEIIDFFNKGGNEEKVFERREIFTGATFLETLFYTKENNQSAPVDLYVFCNYGGFKKIQKIFNKQLDYASMIDNLNGVKHLIKVEQSTQERLKELGVSRYTKKMDDASKDFYI